MIEISNRKVIMRVLSIILVVLGCSSCMLSCETSVEVSSEPGHLLTASGVQSSVIAEHHEALDSMAKKKLDGTLAGTDSGRLMMTLLVACALGAQDTLTVTVDGGDIDFFGEAGLAREWLSRGLKEDSKGWVTACVLAHLSAHRLPVSISMRGHRSVLHPSKDERIGWPLEEGAFFGDIFTPGAIQWFACRGRDPVPVGIDRDCTKQDPVTPTITLCGLTFVGNCNEVCTRNNHKCREVGVTFLEVITVYLQR